MKNYIVTDISNKEYGWFVEYKDAKSNAQDLSNKFNVDLFIYEVRYNVLGCLTPEHI